MPSYIRPKGATSPKQTGTPTTAINYIQQGSTGGDVRYVQEQLRDAGYNIAVDGIFGNETAQAVKDFQVSRGLEQDAVVGPLTSSALATVGKPTPTPTPTPTTKATGGGIADTPDVVTGRPDNVSSLYTPPQTTSRGGDRRTVADRYVSPSIEQPAGIYTPPSAPEVVTSLAETGKIPQGRVTPVSTTPIVNPNTPEVVTGRPDNVPPLYAAPQQTVTGSDIAKQGQSTAAGVPVMPTGVAEAQAFSQPTVQTLATAPLATGEELPPIEEQGAAAGASAGGGISTASGGGAALGGMGGTTPPYTSYTPYGGTAGSVGGATQGADTSDDEERRRIYEVQRRLQMAGINPGELDGMWGPNTQNAVRMFQQQAGLPVTGTVDDAFNGALTNHLISKQQSGQVSMAPAGTPNVQYQNGQVLVNGQPYTGAQAGATTQQMGASMQAYQAPTIKLPTLTEAIDQIYNAVFAPTVSAQQANAKAQFESLISKGMDVLEKRMARKGMLRSGMTLRLSEELLATEGANLAEKILAYEMDARKAALSAGQSYWNTLNSNAMEQQRLSYQMWKDARNDMMEAYKLGLEEEEKELDKAWDRVDMLGYVDNDAAVILGIAPGTPSYEAEKARLDREADLQRQRMTIDAQNTQEKRYKDSIYYKLNNGIPLTPEEANFVGTNPEGNLMAKAIAAAQKDPNWLDAYDEQRDQLIDYYYKKYTGGDSATAQGEPQQGAQAGIDQALAAGVDVATIRASIEAQRAQLEASGEDVDALLKYLDNRK